MTEIAKQMGLSRDTVRSFCRRNGLAGKINIKVLKKWRHEHPGQIKQRLETISKVVMTINEKDFRAEKLYHISLSAEKSMLEKDIIYKEEYQAINTILLKKHQPILGTLLARKPLQ